MKKNNKAVWALADLFRTEAPPDWEPRSIEFERELAAVRAVGTRLTSGHFNKYVKGGPVMRDEIKKLAALQIGDRGASTARPRANRRRPSVGAT